MKQITHKFESGLEVKGTIEELAAIAKTLGLPLTGIPSSEIPAGYYYSESMGLIKTADMKTPHIMQALLKRTKTYFDSMKVLVKTLTPEQFLNHYVNLTNDAVVETLYKELSTRK